MKRLMGKCAPTKESSRNVLSRKMDAQEGYLGQNKVMELCKEHLSDGQKEKHEKETNKKRGRSELEENEEEDDAPFEGYDMS